MRDSSGQKAMIFVKSAQADRVTVEVKFKVNGKEMKSKKRKRKKK